MHTGIGIGIGRGHGKGNPHGGETPFVPRSYDGTTQEQCDILNFGAPYAPFAPSPGGFVVTLTTSAADTSKSAMLALPPGSGPHASRILSLRVALAYTLESGGIGDYGSVTVALALGNDVYQLCSTGPSLLLGTGIPAGGHDNVSVGFPDGDNEQAQYDAPLADGTFELAYLASGAQPAARAYRDGVLLAEAVDASGLPLDSAEGWWHYAPTIIATASSFDLGTLAGVAGVHTITISGITFADGVQGV